MEEDYNYDVFISYKRSPLIEPWVSNFFYKVFTEWLEEKLLAIELPEPRIFFDQKNIEAGKIWPEELKTALKTSKILVPICSPTYFHSQWCKSEWESFKEREKFLGLPSLRVPVRHNDCENFLKGISWSDFYGLTYPIIDWYNTKDATFFYNKVEDLATIVAQAIKNAPPYNSRWPVIEIEEESTNPFIPIQRL